MTSFHQPELIPQSDLSNKLLNKSGLLQTALMLPPAKKTTTDSTRPASQWWRETTSFLLLGLTPLSVSCNRMLSRSGLPQIAQMLPPAREMPTDSTQPASQWWRETILSHQPELILLSDLCNRMLNKSGAQVIVQTFGGWEILIESFTQLALLCLLIML